MPRGLRNSNPLNIRRTTDLWQGLAREQTDPAFYRFTSCAWGYRAAFVVLRTYCVSRGANTPRTIIERWAPAADGNNPDLYLAHVAKRSGLEPDSPLNPYNRAHMVPLVAAMSEVENGRPAVMAHVLQGWALYMG